jgi:hypothetical protein
MRRVFSYFVFPAVLLACSGADQSNLIGPGGPGMDASSGSDATMNKDTGVSDTGQPVKDSDMPDVTMVKDAGPTKTQVSCGGNMNCSVPDQQCCRTGNLNYSYSCQSSGDSCAGLVIPCDKAANCASLGQPNTVCCGHYVPYGQSTLVDMVSCKPIGQCTMQQSSIILCDPKDPNSCAVGTCTLSMFTIPTYYFCK